MATATPSLLCDPCKESGEEQAPVAFCLECRELYCHSCLKCHRKMKLTKSHLYVYVSGDKSGEICPCDLCNTDTEIVESLCIECRELYCTACTNQHRKFKASKHHVVVEIVSEMTNLNITYSGAQIPVNKNKQQNQQYGTSTNKNETKSSVPDDNKTTQELHSKNTAMRSELHQTPLSGTFLCKFSVRTPSDKNSNNINRMISMPDGRICHVDRGDYKMKLYTDDYVLCDEICVPGCKAVTCVDDDTVAVATYSNVIKCYSLKENKITHTGRTLHIDGEIYDLAYRRGEFITRYRKDNKDNMYCGSKLIAKPERDLTLNDFIKYDSASDCVLSAKFSEDTITCYTLNGDITWLITLEGGPTSIVVVQDVVLVANFRNQTIRQITVDGRLLSTPLLTKDHGITNPKAITYQYKQHRLLVAKSYDDNVMVFNLSRKKLH